MFAQVPLSQFHHQTNRLLLGDAAEQTDNVRMVAERLEKLYLFQQRLRVRSAVVLRHRLDRHVAVAVLFHVECVDDRYDRRGPNKFSYNMMVRTNNNTFILAIVSHIRVCCFN